MSDTQSSIGAEAPVQLGPKAISCSAIGQAEDAAQPRPAESGACRLAGGEGSCAIIGNLSSSRNLTVHHFARHTCHLLVTIGRAQGDARTHHGSDTGADCVSCPEPRESSGTSWQPDVAGMAHPYRQVGRWRVGTHLQVSATAIGETGPRGDRAFVAPNHGMLNLRRTAGAGIFGIRSMWSLDPLMGAAGYPLLVQSGETADGVSAFKGQEPDEKRWGLEAPRFDSFSLRLSVNPTSSLALQASAGVLKDPEVIHADADVTRLTASALYARRWEGMSLDAPAAIIEGTLGLRGRHAVIVRAETALKGELYGLDDPRHSLQFPVTRATFGYALRILSLSNAAMHVGGAWSGVRVAEDIRPDYGGHQSGTLGFVRMTVH